MDFKSVEEFKAAANEWMFELGYSCHMHSACNTQRTYSKAGSSAALVCQYDVLHGEATCCVVGTTSFLVLEIRSGKLGWRHPRIEKYIDHVDWLVREHAYADTGIAHQRAIDEHMAQHTTKAD